MTYSTELQLKHLLLDDDFETIEHAVQDEVNIMSILGVQRKELQHSNFLAWLLDPKEAHGFGDLTLKELIRTYYINHGSKEKVS